MRMFGAAVAAAILAGSAQAAPALEDYGRLPGVEQMTLSPSGGQIAMIAVVNEARRVLVISTEGKARLAAPVGSAKVRDLTWAGEDNLVVTSSQLVDLPLVFAGRYELSTKLDIDLNSREARSVFAKNRDLYPAVLRDSGVQQVDGRWYGYFGAIAFERAGPDKTDKVFGHTYPDLYRVDLQDGTVRKAAAGSDLDNRWVVAADGSVAARSSYEDRTGQWRLVAGETGRELMHRKAPFDEIEVEGLGRTPSSVLVVDATGDDTVIEEQPLDGSAAVPLFDDIVPTAYLHSARTRLLLGALVQGPREAVLFDPHLQARFNGARKAFPDYQVQLVSYTDDFGRMIVFTDGGDDSGTYWLVDIATGKAKPLGSAYAAIRSPDVAPTQLVAYKAADGMELDGVLTLPPGKAAKDLPVVVMPHGGPIGPYDRVGFDWWAQAFASRGYAVFQPNYRGSGGHGRAYRQAGFGQWGRKMQTDVSDGLAAIAAKGLVDPKRACVVGASYGGYAALAGVTLQHGLYRCAVSYGGVSDLGHMLYDSARAGGREDDIRFWEAAMGAKGRGDAVLDRLSPAEHADQAEAPILIIHGKDDSVVAPDQADRMAAALRRAGKPVEVDMLPGEDHWLSREETRIATLKASVAFVEKHNPAN